MECKVLHKNKEEVSKISLEVFKTDDYKSMLTILPAYDGMVKEFNRRIEKLDQRRDGI